MAFQAKNVFFIFKWFYKIKRKSNICGTESPISVFLSSINRTHVFLSFPCGSAGQESTHNVEDLGSIPGLGRSPREGKGYPLQYSGLENCLDYVVDGITKNWTRLSSCHFHFQQNTYTLTWLCSVCCCTLLCW